MNLNHSFDMKRLIYNKLLAWKNNSTHKPLILLGARQVGKTWIMKEFGANEYEDYAYVNCDNDTRFAEIIKNDYDISRILLGIQALTGVKVKPHRTLIILDEIQEAPRGLHCLKYFCEDAPEYDVMVAGSMLGVTLSHPQSFPVGKVELLDMYPMTFGEFLMAKGKSMWGEIIEKADWSLMQAINVQLIEELRQYYFVGGMPEVVDDYIKHQDLRRTRELQNNILEAYRRDISKHTTPNTSMRIGQVLNSLPSQLAKENKKFIYGAIKKGARANDFELAIQWLIDAGIVHKVNRVNTPLLPLKFYEDIDSFKLYLLDCGLLGCMAQAPASQILISDNAFIEWKGAFAEQYVLQEMIAAGQSPYYWSKVSSAAEIDFLMQSNDKIVPIEVKAENNVRSRSLAQFCTTYDLKGIRFSLLPYKDQEWMENVPLYAVSTIMHKSSLI